MNTDHRSTRVGLFGPLLFVSLVSSLAVEADAQSKRQYAQLRKRMVEEAVMGAGVKNRRVIGSLLETPRHEFVPSHLRGQAYYDMALPIGNKQTISSPFIVAYMTESLNPQPTDKVLEIGTGSGYQAAVLSPLVDHVYSIEIVEQLGRTAERTLKRLKYKNVTTKVGDGFQGWQRYAPFDKIIVTCSPERVPIPLVQQMREGGLMVIPTGQRYQQTLYLMRKKNGKLEAEELRPTLFVPMTGIAEEGRRVQPDGTRPRAINGQFEEDVPENGFIPGWYYQRQVTWKEDAKAPEGTHFIHLANEQPGRSAHLLQGIAIDGRSVSRVRLSGRVKHRDLWYSRNNEAFPSISLTLYDRDRNELGHHWVGPFRGTDEDWSQVQKTIRVPVKTREAILRVGMFGATGEMSVDDVRLDSLQP